MRSKTIFYIILIFAFVLIQVTFINFISVFGVTPNIVIILIVSISLLQGRIDGAVVGFSAGLCLDAIVGISLGVQALLGMLLGLALGNINKRFFKENVLVMILCTFVSTILYESAAISSFYLYGNSVDLLTNLRNVILPEAIFNSALGVVLFLIIIQINRRWLCNDGKNRY